MWRKTAGESARSPPASYPQHRRHRPTLRHLPRRCCRSDHSALQAEHGQATGSVQLPLGLLLQRRELEPLQLLSLACCFGSASSLNHHRVELSRWTHSATIGAPHHDQLNDAALPILPKQAPSANGKAAETIVDEQLCHTSASSAASSAPLDGFCAGRRLAKSLSFDLA